MSILGSNPSELAGKRNASRPMPLTLLPTINVDDATAQWFKFGSIEQGSGQTLYTGLKVLGSLVANSPISADIKKVNARTITGTGVSGDSMRPV